MKPNAKIAGPAEIRPKINCLKCIPKVLEGAKKYVDYGNGEVKVQ